MGSASAGAAFDSGLMLKYKQFLMARKVLTQYFTPYLHCRVSTGNFGAHTLNWASLQADVALLAQMSKQLTQQLQVPVVVHRGHGCDCV